MSTLNTILIKRRLPDSPLTTLPVLSGGELAFNEKNYTLYYGASGLGSIAIGGDGAFVNRTTDQSIEGDKTFVGSSTLSSLTFSTDSTLDFGGNIVTNLGTPQSNADAATKLYVDDAAATASSSTANLSSEIYNTFVKLVDNRGVNLSGGLTVSSGISSDTLNTSGDARVGGKLTVVGDIEIQGELTSLETTTTVTSSFSVVNAGTVTALTVEQTGAVDIAEFIDDGSTALIIKDGGNVGIGTDTPNEDLTVVGNISATGKLYTNGGIDISAGGSTTLFVENTKTGINTTTPNEALTVTGNISASGNIYAVNGDFTGTLDVDSGTTLGSTLNVTGQTTLNDDLLVSAVAVFQDQTNKVTIDTSVPQINVEDSSWNTLYKTNSIESQATGLTISTTADGGAGITLTPDAGNVKISQNNLVVQSGDLEVFGSLSLDNGSITTDGSGSITGTAETSRLFDFIIDGGTF